MEDTRISVPARVWQMQDGSGRYFAAIRSTEGDLLGGFTAGTPDKARRGLAGETLKSLEKLSAMERHYERYIMGCGDGTVLIVAFRFEAWGYPISGPGRKHSGATCGYKTFDEAVQKAKDHAGQGYGGVTWEHYL